MRILISGASRGLGRALCEEGLKRNYEVSAWVRDASTAPSHCEVYSSDVRERVHVKRIIEEAAPRIHWFIANAGIAFPLDPKDQKSAERAAEMIEVNTTSVVYASYLLAHEWIRLGLRDRKIVLVSSLAAGRGLPSDSVYCASKLALNSFAQGFEHDLRKHGIQIQIIQPGFVDTDINADLPVRPFLMSPSQAAEVIFQGLQSNQFSIEFPWQTTWMSRVRDLMPFFLYRWMVKQLHSRKIL